jgi:DNA-directed RNA polymerase specialized sigma24 family protein
VAAVGDGKPKALREIYRRHGNAVWLVAKRICGSGEQAEQVCEAVFAELWSRPDPARGRLKSWLVEQTHARAVAVAGRDLERDAVLLTSVGGHGVEEAAQLLGVTAAEVKRSVRQGLLSLRQALAAEGVTG